MPLEAVASKQGVEFLTILNVFTLNLTVGNTKLFFLFDLRMIICLNSFIIVTFF